MSTAPAVLLPPDTCIISRLCTDLVARDRETLARSAVILPTRRLATFCLAALAERHAAFVPPLVTTLDGFLTHLHSAQGYPTVSELHVEQLLQLLLASGEFKYLRPAFAHEIRQIFNELTATGLHQDFYPRIQQQLATNPWLAEGELTRQQEKYAELQRLHDALQQQLTADRHSSHSLARVNALSGAATALATSTFAHIYIAAFTSVSKSACSFLQKLAQRRDVTFYFNTIAIDNRINPLRELLVALQITPRVHTATPVTEISVAQFSSPQVEITHALHHAQQLLETGAVRPAEIAIVLSNDRFYLPHLLAVVDLFAFEKNIALPIPLRMTSIGTFLSALSSYGREEFQVPAAIDLILHPHFTLPNLPREQVVAALSNVHRCGHGKLRSALPADSAAWQAVTHIDSIVQSFRCATLREQLAQLKKLLQDLGFFKLATQENFETQSVEEVFAFLQNLAASSLSDTKFSLQEFWKLVAEKFLSLPLRKVGEPLAGVQILSLPEVRAMPFQYIIVVGCNEGFFPKALPGDVILSDKLKTALGLNGWQYLEAMEDVTCNALLHRNCHLTLSYCNSNNARSRFIEKILRTQPHAEINHDTVALQEMLPDQPATVSPVTSIPPLVTQTFFSKISASSAENFIRCPLRHLLHKLNITTHELRAEHSPLEEGDRLHKIIEHFNKTDAYHEICRSTQEPPRKVAQLTALLDTSTRTVAPSLLDNDSAFATHLRLFAWPRLAAFVSRKTAGGDYRELCEYEITLPDERQWFADNAYELQCKIDHVQEDDTHLLLLDYKRKRLPENKELDAAIAMQLVFYAYALARKRQLAEKPSRLAETVTGYYSILDGEFTAVACGTSITPAFLRERFGIAARKMRSLEALVQKMHELLAFRHRSVQQHMPDIAADPSFCGGCNFADFCRKDDPAQQKIIAAQNYLQAYLDDGVVA